MHPQLEPWLEQVRPADPSLIRLPASKRRKLTPNPNPERQLHSTAAEHSGLSLHAYGGGPGFEALGLALAMEFLGMQGCKLFCHQSYVATLQVVHMELSLTMSQAGRRTALMLISGLGLSATSQP
jgi:hypothetical protein